MIRIILLIVCAANFFAAYTFFMTPEVISALYQLPPIDNVHRFLTMIIGALFSVFGLGALLACMRPRKYGAIIIMLLLMHFMIFVIDIIVLSRGQMPWKSVLPEMVYFLIISTALVRWYPVSASTSPAKKPEPEQKQSDVQEEQEQ